MTGGSLVKWSAVAVVTGVAAIAAVVSYNHAFALVQAHGETGVVAHLVPLTVDGLIYASSMALLSSAREGRTAPRLAYGLLALGIGATLAANVAHGLAHGPLGAAIASWPAIALVGSYELLMMIIRNVSQVTGNDAALATYRASVAAGQPISARQLAVRHGISRRQAGHVVSVVTREANGHG